MDTDVRDYVDAHAGEFFAALKQWLTIPSISADPAHSADVRRSAQWLADHLRGAGFETAELWETGTPDRPGLPAVFAQWTAADPDAPSMCTGMRGVIDAQIDVYGPDRDLHSGSFGGAVPNSLHALAALLASLHDADGRVMLPGFYDKVAELTPAERDLFARLPFDEKAWLATAGNSGAAYGEAGFSTIERILARPTARINGMWGGHTGPGGKTIVPREAHAKLSFRLVAHQEPAEVARLLRDFVAQHRPPGLDVVVTVDGPGVRPSASPVDSPAVAAGRRAMERAFGQEVLFTREGGSGPEADLPGILGPPLGFIAGRLG